MASKRSRQSVGPITLGRRRLSNALRPGVRVVKAPGGIHVDWDVPVKVRDGTTLRVNVFRRISDTPAPVIMSAHPYGKDRIRGCYETLCSDASSSVVQLLSCGHGFCGTYPWRALRLSSMS